MAEQREATLEPTRDAASAFCASYHPALVGSLTLYVGDRHLAEELAQEALLRAFSRWERVSALASPEGWVWRVAINLASSRFRRHQVARRMRSRLEASEPGAVDDPDVPWAVDVRRAVAALPARQRQAVILRYFDDLSVEEAAARMDTSANAVRSLTKRAVATLRERFAADLQPREATDG